MANNGAEHRRYERVYFSREQEVTGVLARSGAGADGLQVKILNLSEGGLFFIVKKNTAGAIRAGDRVTLQGLRCPDPLHIAQELSLEIKWISDDALLENIGYGCEFVDLPLQPQQLIRGLAANYQVEGMAW